MSKILLGVGPTKINKDALREFRGDIELCRTDFSRNLVKNQVQKLNYFFGENRYSFAIPGSGSVGMEVAFAKRIFYMVYCCFNVFDLEDKTGN